MRTYLNRYTPSRISDTALAASRQVWLAGLGAAAVSREWIETEAGSTFRALVKEGSVVETRAIRSIGKGVESSMVRANAMWHEARHNVQATVRQVAGNAVLFVKETLPRNLPMIAAPGKVAVARKAKRATTKRATKVKRTRAVKRAR